MLGMRVHRKGETIFMTLPVELHRKIEGGCNCLFCKAHPDKTPMWDTLAVGKDDGNHTWTCHFPELH